LNLVDTTQPWVIRANQRPWIGVPPQDRQSRHVALNAESRPL